MSTLEQLKGDIIHTRNISVSTYDAGDGKIVVEGFLKDDRHVETYLFSGEKRPEGIIHHMIVRYLIESSALEITEVEVEMPGYPRSQCPETIKTVEKVKGLKIAPGFTSDVKALMGGSRGCAHFTTLILAMAKASVQGLYSYQAQKPAKKDNLKKRGRFLSFIIDTCYVWRKDGPVVKKLMDTENSQK